MIWNQKIKQEAKKNQIKAYFILSLSFFLSLSLYSYNPHDASLNSFGISLKVTNYCGIVGASLADLFYQIFGLSSWFFILGLLLVSYKFLKNHFQEPLMKTFLFFVLFLISFCGLSELHFSKLSFYQERVSSGGALGKVLIESLNPLFHKAGTALLLWSIFVVLFVLYRQSLFFRFFFSILSKKNLLIFNSWLKKSFKNLWIFLMKRQKQIVFSKQVIKKTFYLLKNIFSVFKKFEKKQKKDPLQFSSYSKDEEAKAPTFAFKEQKLLKEEDLSIDLKEKKQNSFSKQIKFLIPSELPSLEILSDSPQTKNRIQHQDVEDLSKKLINKLAQFSIKGEIKAIKTGPAVILFEFKPEDHIKVSRIKEMENDLSLALSSESIRIIAPIPGKDVVGIEASRPYREMVYLKNLLKEKSFFKASLPLILGRRADNRIGIKDLARIPHLLVAGTTGSGKSIFIISFISSLLFRHSPESLRLLLIDPKQVDLSYFKGIPHLLSPIITSANKTTGVLQWTLKEMEKRYRSLALFGARDQSSFNEKVKKLNDPEKKEHKIFNEQSSFEESYYFEPLPLIALVIEEFGDLMADKTLRRSIENAIVRLAQKARASGIHLVLAMQSPRKDVVTGLIKTNIPGRISFKVASGTDSRVILDELGAERLLSHGDMLFLEPGNPKPTRYHGPYIREKDIIEIANYWKSQGEPIYEETLIKESKTNLSSEKKASESLDIKQDPMYKEILDFVKSCDFVSTSFLQRKFRMGYPRAARMIEVLFEEGQIGPPQGSKPREVLINK